MHEAADGGLARVRLPGGVLSAEQLRVLAAAAVELGDGHLELTSRANVQIRALRPGAPVELSDRLYAAGLLPSISHERVRNILASPLSGLDQYSRYDVLPVAGELDRLLCARPGLAGLPGRFLFALDDGRGDLASAKADVGLRMVDGERGELLLAGVATGVLVAVERAAEVMVAAADAFLAERAEQQSEAWRLAELTDGPQRVLARLGLEVSANGTPVPVVQAIAGPGERGRGLAVAGRFTDLVGAEVLVVAVPLGVLEAEQAVVLAEVAEQADALDGQRPVLRVTPWRSVVVAGVKGAEDAVRRLEAAGLVLEPSSPWNGVTSCAGRPGCAKALADVRGDARRVVPGWPTPPPAESAAAPAGSAAVPAESAAAPAESAAVRAESAGAPAESAAAPSEPAALPAGSGAVPAGSGRGAGRRVHWSGCERRCGRPGGGFVDVLALAGGGYSVDGVATEVDEVRAQ